jgi:DNA-binding response OmpR family regulator
MPTMKKYKIVIVENDEDEQFFMKEGFDAAGLFDILAQLKNGDALLEWLDSPDVQAPDLILSDLNMPGKNGYDVISEMKVHSKYAGTPVVIISTSSTQSIVDKCLGLGAADYLVKPDTFTEYVPFVKNLYRLIEEKQLIKKIKSGA